MSALSEAATEALGGAIGSCIAFSLTYPLTTISTWQALQQEEHQAAQGPSYLNCVPSPLRDVVQHASTHGWRPLYAGIKPFLVATAASQGLYFYLYSAVRQGVVAAKSRKAEGAGQPPVAAAESRTQDVGIMGSLLVASLAGCVNAAATHPMWLVALRQQAAQRQSSAHMAYGPASTWDIVCDVYQQQGLRGFWKGVVPALIMVVNPTIQYVLYEWLTARLLSARRRSAGAQLSSRVGPVKLNAQDAFLLSALAKLGATLATYPMLLIKSRMQNSGAMPAEEQYKGVWDALVRIIGTEGVNGLFKGMKAKMLQTVLGAALLMGIKEQLYNTIQQLARSRAGPQMMLTR